MARSAQRNRNLSSMEEKKDLQVRTDAFIEAYKKLVEDHKIDFVTFPMFQPTDKGTWEIIVKTQAVDASQLSTPSPFIATK